MLKPDSTRSSFVYPTGNSGPEWLEPDSIEAGAELNDDATSPVTEDVPSDVGLDLRLHEILQQALVATAANGAVIALVQGGRIVCRATSGEMAPSVGVCLNRRSGLSGVCVQSREMELCDDALADPRVNAAASRDLGIRSMVVVPVLGEGKLWGVLELFSSVPRAFSDFDLQALQAMSRKISHTVEEAIAGASAPPQPEATSESVANDPTEVEPPEPGTFFEPEQSQAAMVPRDYRTGALTVAVLVLAVFLGWMVGRVGWSLAVNRAPAPVAITPEEAQATLPVIGDTPAVLPGREEPAAPAKPASAKPKTQTAEPVGGLVVYEHGKVVFRITPSGSGSPSKVESATSDPSTEEPAVVGSGAIQKAVTRQSEPPQSVSPASSYVLERVEPEYPEAARQQHIQGPVVLNALVGTDGSVRELSVISGDALLVKAATEAVRQWRFRPHSIKAQPVEFETRITVNFALPQ